ncbi:MAG: hypothetical protein KatS3mg008_2208 [Acidimicrobiales bacterium]|nr:MAG: hypothetical protein KatS3mg008_2208 [Acidimicrobiales bacterium]
MVESRRAGKGGKRAPKTLFSVGRKSASQSDSVEEVETSASPTVESGDAVQAPEVGVDCPACGALMPLEAHFCGECGQPLDEEEGVLPPPPVGVLEEEGEGGEVVEYEFVEVEEGFGEEGEEGVLPPPPVGVLEEEGEGGEVVEYEFVEVEEGFGEEGEEGVLPPPPVGVLEEEGEGGEVVEYEFVEVEEGFGEEGEEGVLPPPPVGVLEEEGEGGEVVEYEFVEVEEGFGEEGEEGVLPPPPVGVLEEEGEGGEVVEYEFVEVEEGLGEGEFGEGEPASLDVFDEEAEKAAAAAVAVGSATVSEESAPAETFLIDDDVTRPAEFVDKLSGPGTRGGAQPDAPGRPAASRTPLYVGGGVAVLLLLILGVVLMGGGGGDDDDERVQVGAGPAPTVRVERTTTVPKETTATSRRSSTTKPSTTTTRGTTTETSQTSTTSTSTTSSTTSTTSTTVATAPPPPPPPPTEPEPTLPSGSPQLMVSPAGGRLEFSCAAGTTISIFNAGTGVGSFSVIVSELSASPTSGVVNPGSSVSIRVRGVGCPRDYRTSMTVIAGRQYRYDVVVK